MSVIMFAVMMKALENMMMNDEASACELAVNALMLFANNQLYGYSSNVLSNIKTGFITARKKIRCNREKY